MYHSLKWRIELWLISLIFSFLFFFLIGTVIACSIMRRDLQVGRSLLAAGCSPAPAMGWGRAAGGVVVVCPAFGVPHHGDSRLFSSPIAQLGWTMLLWSCLHAETPGIPRSRACPTPCLAWQVWSVPNEGAKEWPWGHIYRLRAGHVQPGDEKAHRTYRRQRNQPQKNLEIWQKKFSAQEHEHLYAKPLKEALLKGNPFRQRETAISLEDIKAAVAGTENCWAIHQGMDVCNVVSIFFVYSLFWYRISSYWR